MKLLYSSHGEASEIYKLCAARIPDIQELSEIEKTLRSASTDPHGLPASILDRREIKSLVQRSDPRYFLFLRELSVHIKKAYDPIVSSLTSIGYTPVKSVLVRLCDGTSPIELLAIGVLSGLCGVKNVTVSLDRATITPEIASACRLCGIERVILCDEISAAGIAAYGARDIMPFSRMIGVGSELLGAASGIASASCESIFYLERRAAIFALFGEEKSDGLIADVACVDSKTLPIVITSYEQLALTVNDKYRERDGIVLLTSSNEETQKILEKCKNIHKKLYGSVPEGVIGVNANEASPLMLSATAPDAIYPYKATDLLVPPTEEGRVTLISFAGTIAKFVGKDILSEAESEAIGERF